MFFKLCFCLTISGYENVGMGEGDDDYNGRDGAGQQQSKVATPQLQWCYSPRLSPRSMGTRRDWGRKKIYAGSINQNAICHRNRRLQTGAAYSSLSHT